MHLGRDLQLHLALLEESDYYQLTGLQEQLRAAISRLEDKVSSAKCSQRQRAHSLLLTSSRPRLASFPSSHLPTSSLPSPHLLPQLPAPGASPSSQGGRLKQLSIDSAIESTRGTFDELLGTVYDEVERQAARGKRMCTIGLLQVIACTDVLLSHFVLDNPLLPYSLLSPSSLTRSRRSECAARHSARRCAAV